MSCKKSNSGPDDPKASGPFVAKVGDIAFPNADLDRTIAKYVASTRMLQIIGQPTDQKETIILNLIPFGKDFTFWKSGTYDFNPVHITNLEYSASTEYSKWNGTGYEQWVTKWEHVQTGKIVIEAISETHIKGTFSFDAVKNNNNGTFDASNVKKITEGAFDLDIVRY